MPALLRLLLASGMAFAAITPIAAEERPISFVNEIAPILVDQCLVCHNTRTSKGRFSVETYATLMKGGESGEAIDPGDSEFSNLTLLVESGDMPKDGDPLSAEQVAVIRRWISQGATLDDGKPADQPLRSIMPKPDHPSPPEIYPAPVSVTALAFAPDASLLAVSGYHEVLLFKPEDGSLVRRISNVAERVNAVAFSPDGKTIAVAAGTPARIGEVKLFRVETGELVAHLASAADSFLDVTFSRDGTRLAATGADRTARVWSVADHGEIARIEDHADWVTGVAFSPDGNRIATSSRDKTAKVFDLTTNECIATFSGHDDAVRDVLFNPNDSGEVVSCGKDGRVRCWSINDMKQRWSFESKGEFFGLAAVFSEANSSRAIAAAASDGTPRIIRCDGSSEKQCESREDWLYSVAGMPEPELKMIAVGSHDGIVSLHETEYGKVLRTFPAMPPRP